MADVKQKTITRLLIANRGEIACRIIRTAREMGISTVAIYANADADAPFVKEADTAIALNGDSPFRAMAVSASRTKGASASASA